ncbi:MAG: BamA/TamA family outer membrane protein [Gemmatimonadota bacterium]|nr:MAG: BamA/TamA family outer membrane protein [Gemmatimonadota bacterium]
MCTERTRKLSLLPLLFALACMCLHSSATSQTGYQDTLGERQYRYHARDIVRFLGDVHIAEDEEIDGDVVTIGGSIKVRGRIDGDAVAVFGSIVMAPFSTVEGDAVSVIGRVRMAQGAEVYGDIVDGGWKWGGRREYEWDDEEWDWDDEDWDDEYHYRYKNWSWFSRENMFDNIRYNRVEGLFLGWGFGGDRYGTSGIQFFGNGGYGFKNDAWRYQLGLSRWWGNQYRIEIGVKAYDLTDSDDRWLIPTLENSLAAFFFREDFQDYFRRYGATAFIKQNITPYFRLSAEYRADTYENMERKANWALFGGDKIFRTNPDILPPDAEEDEMRSIIAGFDVDTRDDYESPSQGWFVRGEYEYAGRSLQGDFEFDRFMTDIRRYQRITRDEYIDARIRVGSVKRKTDVIPNNKLFDLGGIGTLRGFRFKEFTDLTKMVLGNLEYRIRGDKFGTFDNWLFEDFTISFFGDAGWAGHTFEDIDFENFKTDIGVGLSNDDQDWRIDFAKRLDRKESVVVTFRINRTF